MNETPAVTVERLDAVCLVEAGGPAEDVRWQLDRVARTRLEGAFAAALEGVLDVGDSSVWLIRELELDIDLDVADEDEVARAWGRAIAHVVVGVLARGPDGVRVIRFDDRADFVAQFVDDVAAGVAWSRWFYHEVDALRVLPSGAAVREALLRDPDVGLLALARVAARGHAVRLVDVLSEADAAAVLAAIAGSGNATEIERWTVEAALAVWPGLALDPERGLATPKNALRLQLALAERDRAPLSAAVAATAEGVLALAEVLRRAASPAELARRLARGDVVWAEVGAADELARALPFLRVLSRLDPELPAEVMAAIAPEGPREVRSGGADRIIGSEYAGVFLLVPALAELHLVRDDAALRLAVLARCLGRSDALHDDAVRLAAGAEDVSTDELRERAAGWSDADAASCRLALLERLLGLGRADAHSLVVDVVAGDVVLVRDAARDAWLYADTAADPVAAAARGLRIVHEAAERAADCVLVGPALAEHGAAEVLHASAREIATAPKDANDALARWLARARPAAPDLDALALFGPEARRFELSWALVAHAVVRGFAARLMGFDVSAIPYLQATFLHGRGTVREREASFEVELPPSPLRLVLQLAGVDGQTYTAPWLDGEVTLRLQAR